MSEATLPADAGTERSAIWRRVLRVAVAALLLAPLPALAGTLTIGAWQFSVYPTPNWSTLGSTGNNLSIQGDSGTALVGDTSFYIFAPITYGSTPATQISAVTSNFDKLAITSGPGVKISMLFASSIPFTPTNFYGPNMFTGTLPSSLGTINGTIPSRQNYIAIQFDFFNGTSWTSVPSSPFTITFSEM